MKAVVLAAGRGNRLKPLTDRLPKPLVPYLNHPLLEWVLDSLKKNGVQEFFVNTFTQGEKVEEFLKSRREPVTFVREEVLRGTGGGVTNFQPFLQGEEAFVVANADSLLTTPWRRSWETFLRSNAWMMMLLVDARRGYSLLSTDETGRILFDPQGAFRGYTFTGISFWRPLLFDFLPEGPSDLGPTLFRNPRAHGKILGSPCSGPWIEFTDPLRYLSHHVHAARRAPKSFFRPGLHLSVADPGAKVEEGCRIERSVLWDGSTVEGGSFLNRCILLPGARVRAGERFEGSIILEDRREPLPTL